LVLRRQCETCHAFLPLRCFVDPCFTLHEIVKQFKNNEVERLIADRRRYFLGWFSGKNGLLGLFGLKGSKGAPAPKGLEDV